MRDQDIAAAGLIVVIWGTSFVVMKLVLQNFTPFQLGAARYLFGMIPLILVVRPPRLHWKWVVLFGLFQGLFQFGCVFFSLRFGMTAALTSVLLQSQVFFTALFSAVFLNERPSRRLWSGMVFAALALGCFVFNYAVPQADLAATGTVIGFSLCLGAAAMWAISNIIVKMAQKESPDFDSLSFIVWCSTVPIVPFVLLSLLLDPPAMRWRWLEAPWQAWAAAAYLGWSGMVVGNNLWTALVKRYGANRIAPFSLGIPVVGLMSGMLLLDEGVTYWQWAGIGMIVIALLCVLWPTQHARS
ncbi:EamA family transporter [Azohydromonas australica]|uniref:EamA family transporter n=1 Tax=Azohydromonas australica TaxID=364039 RepID=UPI0012EBB074|nr:EamA family transporter [Azohydromonas australica]